MPFITEAIWAALPHRASDPELLIVARWPGVGKRDETAEVEVEALIELVTMIRNARASARLAASDWLETWVYVPPELGPTFEALRPAIERLARARPLHRTLTAEALHGVARTTDLTTVAPATDIEAAIRPAAPDGGVGDLEQARLAKELLDAEGWLLATRQRLGDPSFVAKAPAAVVEAARLREAELAEQVARLRKRIGG
jgi:valyl-tRNA synthetase